MFKTVPTIEGAGVHLKRGFGYGELPQFDPFLLFDDFSSSDFHDFLPGFPMHPHRGIETVTYILKGEVDHKDSLGNSGRITDGSVQWMTAGSGIVHEEMPQRKEAGIRGFQLWVNLPQKDKMMSPRYQDIPASAIPTVHKDDYDVKVIAGTCENVAGPVSDLMVSPLYLDVSLRKEKDFSMVVPPLHTVFLYVFEGSVLVDRKEVGLDTALLLTLGEKVMIRGGDHSARFLLIAGRPIGEPVAWYGPIVMNTEAELREAFADYSAGTFVKQKK